MNFVVFVRFHLSSSFSPDETAVILSQSKASFASDPFHGENTNTTAASHFPKTTIGFVVTVTDCGDNPDLPFPITEGAAVLRHSIHRTSIHGTLGGKYDYRLYAVYHPNAEACVQKLSKLGYTLLKRDTPVRVEEIRGDFLREKIGENGCCGEKELIKFEALRLTQHAAVVVLDLDVLILKPLDVLFDLILDHVHPPTNERHLQWPDVHIPDDIWLLYTNDYAMVNPYRKLKPIQGGFVVLRPNRTIYEEIMEIVREGDYRDRGWGGVTGKFWGSMTFQGLLPYFYLIKQPGHTVELNRCLHDNMVSNPREKDIRPGKNESLCFTMEENCEDCRERTVDEIYSTHFTICQKPWLCALHANTKKSTHRLCRKLHDSWFMVRSEMERAWGRSGRGMGNNTQDALGNTFAYCHGMGEKNYEFIEEPYGLW